MDNLIIKVNEIIDDVIKNIVEGNRQGVAPTGVAPHLPILYRYRAIAELRILPLADGQRSARRIAHRSSRPRPLGDLP